jgi:hypothetical protein
MFLELGEALEFTVIDTSQVTPSRITASNSSGNGTQFTISPGSFKVTLSCPTVTFLNQFGGIVNNGRFAVTPRNVSSGATIATTFITRADGSSNPWNAPAVTSIDFIVSNPGPNNMSFWFMCTEMGNAQGVNVSNPVCTIVCID